jgi:hypothetical protein
MKTIVTFTLFSIVIPLFASASTNDVIAIYAAAKNATEIRATRSGYSITTPSGTRTAYKTPNGYYVEGGGGEPNKQIIKTSTGYRIEPSATRGAAFSSHRP